MKISNGDQFYEKTSLEKLHQNLDEMRKAIMLLVNKRQSGIRELDLHEELTPGARLILRILCSPKPSCRRSFAFH